ncbi:HpcH/HpaI aldolase/citrate lyase family protein [Mycobacterium sp. C31M]
MSRHSAALHARSLLFVPGDRADRFGKAVAAGADQVILDLEDAVAPAAKEQALAHVIGWLSTGGRAAVRINGVGSYRHTAELEALCAVDATLVLPKAESADAVAGVADRLCSEARIIALIETPRGIQAAHEIAAVPKVVRLALGNVDLSTELGVDPASRAALAYARGRLVMAAAAAGMSGPIDGVTTSLDSADIIADSAYGRELGFTGKLCIHPRQVPVVNQHFSPSESEFGWAQRVLAAARAGGAVAVVDGKMIDKPVVDRAERVVAAYQRITKIEAPAGT